MPEPTVAVVTGASSGIGRETAIAFARRGYAVVLAARRVDRLESAARACREAGAAEAVVAATDVSREESVNALVESADRRFGRIDVMVNNAGHGLHALVHRTSPEQMRRMIDVDFLGVFYGCRAVAPVMVRRRSGHIFNVSSVVGKRGVPFNGAYCAAKFAVVGLTDALRVEMKPHHVRVTCVCPGLTDTEFFDHVEGGGGSEQTTFRAVRTIQPAGFVARRIAAAVGKDVPEIVFTPGGKALVLIAALWPKLADRIMGVYHDRLVRASATSGGRR